MAEVVRAGGREFSAEVIERIRDAVQSDAELTRCELSRQVCRWLSWRQPNGRLREVSCRVALRALEQRGVIKLPVARAAGDHGRAREVKRDQIALEEPAVALPTELRKLGPIELVVVGKHCPQEYQQWKQALERFHPEGHVALPQAQVRYLIRCRYGVLGALCFSAAARHLAARDAHIGWSTQARAVNRELVVANSRFVLLPWVKVKGLASHVLARAARQLAHDWHSACGLRPVLLETYADAARYRATCYRAAGWQRVGATSGRTRNDRTRTHPGRVRDIYLLPLVGDYRRRLCSEPIVRKPPQPSSPERSWARRELWGAQLGDPRRFERLVSVLEDFYAKPNASLPQACHHSWGRLKGAYRLLSNDHISLRDILAPHYASTAERMNSEPVVLAVQDTTSLNYSTHGATTGLGTITSQADGALGLEVHDTLAFTPGGVPLGLVDVQVWARDPAEFGKKHTRRQRPIENKQSYKWLASFQAAAHAQRLCPHTRVVSIGDRESDVFELFELARSRDDHPALLVRATADRCVQSAGSIARLWQVVESQKESQVREVQVPRTAQRPARLARLSVRYCPVEVRPPRHGAAGRRSLWVWAVLAREHHPPAGVEPLEWMLLTTIEVGTFAQAMEKIDWYVRRWGIEVYHHTLKSGCLVEEREITTAAGLTNALAIDMIVAWRILYMTRLGREVPELPCTAVFTEDEWQSLLKVTHPHKPLPVQPPSLNAIIRMLAKLGGHIGRKSDGAPGVESMWTGLMRLSDISMCWRLFGPSARAP
ncbi:MAG: IS4 family transposase [Deltaproteobacteria bacterium]|nr:IS4 family transposase [Deltaproteobacteria bacterium]